MSIGEDTAGLLLLWPLTVAGPCSIASRLLCAGGEGMAGGTAPAADVWEGAGTA